MITTSQIAAALAVLLKSPFPPCGQARVIGDVSMSLMFPAGWQERYTLDEFRDRFLEPAAEKLSACIPKYRCPIVYAHAEPAPKQINDGDELLKVGVLL